MTNPKRAEELAGALVRSTRWHVLTDDELDNAAAELRRLSAVEAEREEAKMLYEDACISHNMLAANCDRLSAELERVKAEKTVTMRTIDAAADLLSRFVGSQTITSGEFEAVLSKLRAIQGNNWPAQPAARGMEPLTDEQLDRAVQIWFGRGDLEMRILAGEEMRSRMRAAIEAAHRITSSKEGQSNG